MSDQAKNAAEETAQLAKQISSATNDGNADAITRTVAAAAEGGAPLGRTTDILAHQSLFNARSTTNDGNADVITRTLLQGMKKTCPRIGQTEPLLSYLTISPCRFRCDLSRGCDGCAGGRGWQGRKGRRRRQRGNKDRNHFAQGGQGTHEGTSENKKPLQLVHYHHHHHHHHFTITHTTRNRSRMITKHLSRHWSCVFRHRHKRKATSVRSWQNTLLVVLLQIK